MTSLVEHQPSRHVKKLWFFALSSLLLFLGFFANQWAAAEQEWFDTFQIETESLVIGRLVKSRQDGLLSSAGLTGWGNVDELEEWANPAERHFQYRAYIENLPFETFRTYDSQIGFQAMLFGLLDLVTDFAPAQNIAIFKMLTALLSAMSISAMVLWFYVEAGPTASLVVLATALLCQWLTVFARNLWWSLWAFYVPMLVSMAVLSHEERTGRYSHRTAALMAFAAVFVKCLFNGYEYITTTLMMMLVPYVYYAIRDSWTAHTTGRRIAAVSLAAGVAVGVSLLVLCLQIGAVRGGPEEAAGHLLFALGKRTYGDPGAYPIGYQSSLRSSLIGVLIIYLKGAAIDLRNQVHIGSPWTTHVLRISFLHLIALFFLATCGYAWMERSTDGTATERKRTVALIEATWFSLLAPMSWFIVFKAHSYVHTFMNHITWHMPFTFFGFALCGRIGVPLARYILGLAGRLRSAPTALRQDPTKMPHDS